MSIMALKNKQRIACELLALRPDMKEWEIAEEVGVSQKTLWTWKKNPEFMEYYHSVCETQFKELEALAVRQLKANVSKGNQKAIEYALDYLGYKATQKVEAELTNDITINVE